MSIVTRHIQFAHIAGIAAGRLIVYAPRWRTGTVTIHLVDEQGKEGRAFYAELKTFTDNGTDVKAAVFPQLLPANYKVHEPGYTYGGRTVTVFPGEVAEADFR
jgi:hypothetical protein